MAKIYQNKKNGLIANFTDEQFENLSYAQKITYNVIEQKIDITETDIEIENEIKQAKKKSKISIKLDEDIESDQS